MDPIEAWSKHFVKTYKSSTWTDKTCLLIAAVHTQVGYHGHPLSNEVVENTIAWLRADFASGKSSSTSSISVNLYADMLRCCLRKQYYRALHVSDIQQALLDNLRMHVSMLASVSSSGWLHTLLTDPEVLKKCFIPDMFDY